jgi:hypothetical protein
MDYQNRVGFINLLCNSRSPAFFDLGAMKPSAQFLPEGEAIIAQDKRSEVLGQRSTKAPVP